MEVEKQIQKGLCKVSEQKLNKHEIFEIFNNIDIDKNNYIEQEEFAKAAIDKNVFLSEKMLKFAFNFFDKDNNGLITIEEILKLFKNNKYNDNDFSNEIKKIMKMIDKNDDGDINFEEFSQFMKKLLEQL